MDMGSGWDKDILTPRKNRMSIEEHCRALGHVRGLVRGCQQPDRKLQEEPPPTSSSSSCSPLPSSSSSSAAASLRLEALQSRLCDVTGGPSPPTPTFHMASSGDSRGDH